MSYISSKLWSTTTGQYMGFGITVIWFPSPSLPLHNSIYFWIILMKWDWMCTTCFLLGTLSTEMVRRLNEPFPNQRTDESCERTLTVSHRTTSLQMGRMSVLITSLAWVRHRYWNSSHACDLWQWPRCEKSQKWEWTVIKQNWVRVVLGELWLFFTVDDNIILRGVSTRKCSYIYLY